MSADTSERGLERLICVALTGAPCDPGTVPVAEVRERPVSYGVGWIGGRPEDYEREYCVDLTQLAAFLRATQLDVAEVLALEENGPARRKFLARLQGEITKRGTIDGEDRERLFRGRVAKPARVENPERYLRDPGRCGIALPWSQEEAHRNRAIQTCSAILAPKRPPPLGYLRPLRVSYRSFLGACIARLHSYTTADPAPADRPR